MYLDDINKEDYKPGSSSPQFLTERDTYSGSGSVYGTNGNIHGAGSNVNDDTERDNYFTTYDGGATEFQSVAEDDARELYDGTQPVSEEYLKDLSEPESEWEIGEVGEEAAPEEFSKGETAAAPQYKFKKSENKTQFQKNGRLDKLARGVKKFCLKAVHKPYYYIPPCPKCGSEITGRLIQNHWSHDVDYMIEQSLRNGELVNIADDENDYSNCFCYECGNRWYIDLRARLFSLERIKAEGELRHIPEFLESWHEEQAEGEHNSGMFMKFIGKF